MATLLDSITPVLTRPSDFAPGFEADPVNLEIITEDPRVLCIGAGGLGCELLKDMAMSGFRRIDLIDLDSIDISNLNRQLLYRMSDVGKMKAQCAAEKIMKRCPDVKVTPHSKPCQQFAPKWYTQFNVIIAGLDNQEARRWVNETIVDQCKFLENGDVDVETVIPLLDGGTEGFSGQCRMFVPRKTSCFQCQAATSVDSGFELHMCTPAVNPRIPEHCCMYAFMFQWPKLMELNSPTDFKLYESKGPDDKNPSPVKLDKDDPMHMTWLFNQAMAWAEQKKIQGVTYNMMMAVTKNIIPAIASTNALVSASCVSEAFKYITRAGESLNNWFAINGASGLGTYCNTFPYFRNPECDACKDPFKAVMSPSQPFSDLIKFIMEQKALAGKTISTLINPETRSADLHNLMGGSHMDKPLSELIDHRNILHMTDSFGFPHKVHVFLK